MMEFMAVMRMVNGLVKIIENKKTWEEEPGAKEWIRNPSIQIRIVRRRRIIGHNRRTFIVVVIIDDRWIGVASVIRRRPGLRVGPLILADP